jgi:predicted small secreted protein
MRSPTPRLLLALLALSSALLAGCATVRSVSSEVSSFGEWPPERAGGTYAFERLPSQQAQAAASEMLEAAAAPALEKAGFKPAAGGQQPDVLVQVGARDARYVVQPWDDPFWWRGGFGYWRHGPWMSPRWGMGMRYDFPRYESQVALLIRDRATGKPLFETRAASDSNLRADSAVFGALFTAALMDFPRLGMNPRRVVVELPPS